MLICRRRFSFFDSLLLLAVAFDFNKRFLVLCLFHYIYFSMQELALFLYIHSFIQFRFRPLFNILRAQETEQNITEISFSSSIVSSHSFSVHYVCAFDCIIYYECVYYLNPSTEWRTKRQNRNKFTNCARSRIEELAKKFQHGETNEQQREKTHKK